MMHPPTQLDGLLHGATPFLALAPMQDVTDGAFCTLIHQYGGADVYWTEYFRVQEDSVPEKRIIEHLRQNTTGRPVIAQMIGNDIPALVRTAKVLQRLPVAAIDLNLGCPAPVVYRKRAGGGLLREVEQVDAILGALRDAIDIRFTVKTRLGFASVEEFDRLLPIFATHALDALTVHARTVKQMYTLPVHYERIRQASAALRCPVIANGHVCSAAQAQDVLTRTNARGLMIGRAAIRSPWIFNQIRQQLRGAPVTLPTGRDLWRYIRALWDSQAGANRPEKVQCARMKKFMNYLGEGLPAPFLYRIRRAETAAEFNRICEDFLDHDQPMALEPLEEGAWTGRPAGDVMSQGRAVRDSSSAISDW
ncbi:MAG: tRNA-dihydrouridine synthase family protein [Vicinamibacterales bacterium]|nr:tRNA-dihydrouridine synthase family protein [Vicinamibacterales bacterium]